MIFPESPKKHPRIAVCKQTNAKPSRIISVLRLSLMLDGWNDTSTWKLWCSNQMAENGAKTAKRPFFCSFLVEAPRLLTQGVISCAGIVAQRQNYNNMWDFSKCLWRAEHCSPFLRIQCRIWFCHQKLSSLTELVLLAPSFFADYRLVGLKLMKLADPQMHWHSGAPPGVTNPGPVFETQVSIQGASCAS